MQSPCRSDAGRGHPYALRRLRHDAGDGRGSRRSYTASFTAAPERPAVGATSVATAIHGATASRGSRRSYGAFLAAAVLATAATTALAAPPRIHAITGARIVIAPGRVIDHGTVVLRDGLVEAVGAKLTPPPDAEVIAAEPGWSVYPAFIDAASSVGLDTEAAPARGGPPGRGAAEAKPLGARHELKSVHPEDAVVDRVDLTHDSIKRHREMGFAVAQVLPDKGVFRGESALLLLREGPAHEVVARGELSQVIALEASSFMARQYPSSKFGAVATVRQVLLDAGRQREWRERYAANPAGMAPPGYRSSDAPLIALLAGERAPVFVAINGLDPGRFGVLAAEFGLKGMVVARTLGDREADLRAAGMPVLLPLELPEKPDLGDGDALVEVGMDSMQASLRAPRLPAALDAAGVKVAFVTLGMKNPRQFQENLAAVVKAGLAQDKALAAVTTTPAELLGVSRSMGTIEAGKQANLLVVEGDLFTEKPALRHLFVEGYHEKIEAEKTVGDPNAVVDPRGTWSIVSEVMGRSVESTWTITGSEERGGTRRYKGFSESARSGKRDFTSVDLKGNAMTVISSGAGGEMKITVIVSGEKLSGDTTMESERGSVRMKVEGRRTSGPEGGTR